MTDLLESSFNRLIHSRNPYLAQHAESPIHWWAWGESALAEAKRRGCPVFISIGYSTCHWCHVMAREAFSDLEVADLLNRHFVSIKVDREEHPQIDAFYLNAAQLMKVQGGWPLSVFCDFEAKPFFIGTYFPVRSESGISFLSLLHSILNAWKSEKNQMIASGEQVYQTLSRHYTSFDLVKETEKFFDAESRELFGEDKEFFDLHQKYFDSSHGGFKFQAHHKFPCLMNLSHLLKIYQREEREPARSMVEKTVWEMMRGGIYDQLGGGLCRYSTDYSWRVPHFEKMLYDNALLLSLLGDLFLLTRKDQYRIWAYEIIDYYEKEMKCESLFLSAEDADSEGEEGTYYLWSYDEMECLLVGEESDTYLFEVIKLHFGVVNSKKNILRIHRSIEEISKELKLPENQIEKLIKVGKQKLLARREKRIRPFKDLKLITSWNGLMIASYMKLANIFQDPSLGDRALAGLNFYHHFYMKHKSLPRYFMSEEGVLTPATTPAYLSDWAAMLHAVLVAYQFDFESRWKEWAFELSKQVEQRFALGDIFSEVESGHQFLLEKMVDSYDGVEPSGNSLMAYNFVRLDVLFPEINFSIVSENIFKRFHPHLSGTSLPFMISGLHLFKCGLPSIEISGNSNRKRFQSWLGAVKAEAYPYFLITVNHQKITGEKIQVKICKDRICTPPLEDLNDIKRSIKKHLKN